MHTIQMQLYFSVKRNKIKFILLLLDPRPQYFKLLCFLPTNQVIAFPNLQIRAASQIPDFPSSSF